MNRRRFIKAASGVFVPASFGIFVPQLIRAQSVLPNRRKAFQPAGGGGGGITPPDITGLHLWLRASNDSGTNVSCYNDAGSTLCTDGQTIQEWHDESGNGFNATNAGAASSRLNWHASVVNSKGVVRGGGAGDANYIALGDVMTGLASAEWFVVVKIDTDPPGAAGSAGCWRWGTHASYAGFPYTTGSIGGGFGTDTVHTVGNPTPALTSFRLYNEETSSGNYKARLDGTELYSSGTNTVAWDTAPEIGGDVAATRYIDGDIAEIVVYDNIIGSSDRSALLTYFDTKYALDY